MKHKFSYEKLATENKYKRDCQILTWAIYIENNILRIDNTIKFYYILYL